MSSYAVTEDLVSDTLKKQMNENAFTEIVAHTATNEDVDKIIDGSYVDKGSDEGTEAHYTHIATSEDIDNIVNNLFK